MTTELLEVAATSTQSVRKFSDRLTAQQRLLIATTSFEWSMTTQQLMFDIRLSSTHRLCKEAATSTYWTKKESTTQRVIDNEIHRIHELLSGNHLPQPTDMLCSTATMTTRLHVLRQQRQRLKFNMEVVMIYQKSTRHSTHSVVQSTTRVKRSEVSRLQREETTATGQTTAMSPTQLGRTLQAYWRVNFWQLVKLKNNDTRVRQRMSSMTSEEEELRRPTLMYLLVNMSPSHHQSIDIDCGQQSLQQHNDELVER